MSDPTRFVCTLSDEDAPRREADGHALAAEMLSHRWEGERRAELVFRARAQPLVQQFVRDESACCSFFDFTVESDDGEARLHVEAPEGAEHMLQQLVTAFTG